MAVRRSPSQPENPLKTPPPLFYGSDSAINALSKQPCSLANFVKRQKRTSDVLACTDSDSVPISQIAEIKSMFVDIKSQQDSKFEALSSAMNIIITQNQDIQKTVDHMNSQYEELLLKTNSLEGENRDLKERISGLESKVELLEKSALSATVEIRNIPKQEPENKLVITKIVQNIGVALGLESSIQNSEIREIYRAKKGAIVVAFTCTGRKEAVISGYRNLQKTRRATKEQPLNTSQLNLTGPATNVFISEYLTRKASHLYFLAREHVKNKKIFSTWVSYGAIYAKKEDGMAPARIDSEDDLLKIVSL